MCMIQQWKVLHLLKLYLYESKRERREKKGISLQRVQLSKIIENPFCNILQVVVRQIPVDYNVTEERISLCLLIRNRFAKKHVMRRLSLPCFLKKSKWALIVSLKQIIGQLLG